MKSARLAVGWIFLQYAAAADTTVAIETLDALESWLWHWGEEPREMNFRDPVNASEWWQYGASTLREVERRNPYATELWRKSL